MHLSTEHLDLRSWTEQDLPAFAAMHADPLVMRYYPSIWTAAESAERFRAMIDHFDREGFGLLCATEKSSAEFIGLVGLQRMSFDAWFCPGIEIGWRLNPKFWGKGYATEGAHALLHEAFQTLQLEEVYAVTSLLNHPSEMVMQRLGMEWVGEFEHPRVAVDHVLRPHVVYRIDAATHARQQHT